MNKPGKPENGRLRIFFILNRRSGNRNSEELIELIDQKSNSSHFDYSLYTLEGIKEDLIRKEIENYNPNIVAVAGGDGTINLIAGILSGTKIPLSIIPFGSANGMAKDLDIPVKLEAALDILTKGKPKEIDLIRINDRTTNVSHK